VARAYVLVTCAALAALALSGCNAAGMRVHNLGELHTDDGFHRYSAVQLSSWDWALRQELGGLFSGGRVQLEEIPPKEIDDPNEACLEHLVELGRHTGEGGFARSQRIATYAEYIVSCPWKLSRERCAILLGREGRDLDLRGNPAPRASPTPAGADEVAGVLSELVAATRPLLEAKGEGYDAEALAAACEHLRGLDLDLDGARRTLLLTALLERRGGDKDERLQPLRELVLALQRLTVSRALTTALADRQPFERQGSDPGWGDARVRGAAVEGWVQAGGPLALAEFLQQLDPREEIEPDVLLAILVGVAREGLPQEIPGASERDVAQLNERWISALLGIALDHPDGRLRVAAMHALSRISGGELASLREEDWLAWIEARRAAPAEAAAP
jgi:hypothetical protein